MIRKKEILLEYLLGVPGFKSSSELAKFMNLSTKTISRYIKDLNESLSDFGFKIESKPGLGYGFSLTENERSLLRKVVNENILVKKNFDEDFQQVFKKLLEDKKLTLYQLSLEVYMSESLVNIQLEKLKNYIRPYGLQIYISNTGHIELKGDYESKLIAVANYIQNLPDVNMNNFLSLVEKKDFEEIRRIFIAYLFEENIEISDLDFNFIVQLILVCLNEIRAGKRFDLTGSDINRLEEVKDFEKLFKSLDKKCRTKDFNGYKWLVSDWLNRFMPIKPVEKYPYLRGDIIEVLSSFHISITDNLIRNDNLIDQLLIHMTKFIERSKNGVTVENLLLNDIKKGFILEFNIAYYLCKKIGEKYDSLLNENEIGFIAIYLATQRETLDQEDIRAVIICQYGQGTANLLKEKIKKSIPKLNILGVISYVMREEAYLLKPDIIISSTLLDDCNYPYIYIKDIFGDELIPIIQRRIGQHKDIETLLKLIPHEAFYNIEAENKEDAIRELGRKMLKDQLIGPDIIEEVIRREDVSSTEIGNLVATPHSLSGSQLRSIIGVGKTSKPIKWGNELVQLVFFISFNERKKSDLRAFRGLYNFIEDHKNVNDLIEDYSYIRFVDLFSKLQRGEL